MVCWGETSLAGACVFVWFVRVHVRVHAFPITSQLENEFTELYNQQHQINIETKIRVRGRTKCAHTRCAPICVLVVRESDGGAKGAISFLTSFPSQNIRLIGELTKFQLCNESLPLRCLSKCLETFTHHNIDVACHLLESCGRYLLIKAYTRTNNLLQQLYAPTRGAEAAGSHLPPCETKLHVRVCGALVLLHAGCVFVTSRRSISATRR